jgi:hypothetical protein
MEKNALACPVPREDHRKPNRPVKAARRNQAEIDIDRAIERVYRTYGPDLTVFFDAVHKQQQQERLQSERSSNDSIHSVNAEA